jgi:hypothetical protein
VRGAQPKLDGKFQVSSFKIHTAKAEGASQFLDNIDRKSKAASVSAVRRGIFVVAFALLATKISLLMELHRTSFNAKPGVGRTKTKMLRKAELPGDVIVQNSMEKIT